jgi:hypothetical protein
MGSELLWSFLAAKVTVAVAVAVADAVTIAAVAMIAAAEETIEVVAMIVAVTVMTIVVLPLPLVVVEAEVDSRLLTILIIACLRAVFPLVRIGGISRTSSARLVAFASRMSVGTEMELKLALLSLTQGPLLRTR